MRLAFAGTPEVALPALRRLLDAERHEVAVVITRPPAPAGRGRTARTSAVHRLAEQAGLPVLTPRRPGEEQFLAELRRVDVECVAVVAYGALIPPAALAVPRHGWVNLHFSLLPAWRGAAPVQHAILHGDEITGSSTFLIDRGLDTGPVYGVLTEPIRPTDTAGDLLERLAASGADLLAATMDGIADGSLRARPQASEGVSAAPRLTPEDARVDWSAPALHIDRLVRACTPQPGAWTTWRGQRLRIGPVRRTDATGAAPGELITGKREVCVGTATGAVELGWVQPPGRRPSDAADWARGARPEPGERLD